MKFRQGDPNCLTVLGDKSNHGQSSCLVSATMHVSVPGVWGAQLLLMLLISLEVFVLVCFDHF